MNPSPSSTTSAPATPSPAEHSPAEHSPAEHSPAEHATAPPRRHSGRFARLPRLAGRSFIPVGLFARLPLAMLTVGALTLVTAVSGSYAVGGAAAGAVGIGSALGAPVLGVLADRLGQRPVLLFAAVFNAAAVAALILTAYLMPGGAELAAAGPVLAAAFLAGVSCPQVGPLARVRWMALTARSSGNQRAEDLDTALSYESTADELTFVLGPALVGILASLISPWLPLALAAALTLTLVPAFAVHPTHRAVQRTAPRTPRRTPGGGPPRTPGGGPRGTGLRTGTPSAAAVDLATAPQTGNPAAAGGRTAVVAAVAVPVLAMVCMGTFFGATQTSLSSFSAGFAGAELAGLLYAVMGLSSAAAALSVAYWPRRFGVQARWLACAALMTGLAGLLLLPSSALPMILVLLVLGLPVGPLMVTVFAIGGLVAPEGKLGTVMTALASGLVAGTAVGSSIAGRLAQDFGYSTAFLVPVCAAAALFLLGAAAAVVLHRRNGAAASRQPN